jgi:hypothetical protein
MKARQSSVSLLLSQRINPGMVHIEKCIYGLVDVDVRHDPDQNEGFNRPWIFKNSSHAYLRRAWKQRQL